MQYPNSISGLQEQLEAVPSDLVDTDITNLAKVLIAGAEALDLGKLEHLGVSFRYKGVERNYDNPVEFTHEGVIGAPWADDAACPLQPGEQWNEGRRATNTGTVYEFDVNGRPINPYMNTGLTGRGSLGVYGPNHAVDNGVIIIHPDGSGVPAAYATLGILRKFDNNAPAFAGGFAKFQETDEGGFVLDTHAIIQSRMEEFFEEMISGSIPLSKENEKKVEPALQNVIAQKMARNGGIVLKEADIEEMCDQTITAFKLQQVQQEDPGFLDRLYEVIATGKECFAGPVLNDNRNTNQAWIETRLSWFLMDDATWQYIRGENPKYDYKFSPGDDASDVKLLRLDADLIRDAFASHGPMFAFMAASFLLDRQEKGIAVEPSIMAQMRDIGRYLKSCTAGVKPTVQDTTPAAPVTPL